MKLRVKIVELNDGEKKYIPQVRQDYDVIMYALVIYFFLLSAYNFHMILWQNIVFAEQYGVGRYYVTISEEAKCETLEEAEKYLTEYNTQCLKEKIAQIEMDRAKEAKQVKSVEYKYE